MPQLRAHGFNDRASSVVVLGSPWEVCENADFGGRCMVLRRGQYPSLSAMGLNDRVSSVRAVIRNVRLDDDRYAPPRPPAYDNRRRGSERLYQADVTSVRAVVGTPQQRCWVEREQIAPERRNNSVPGAVIGAVLGGVLGHQVGGGTGRDLATAGGAVAGAVVGANVGRSSSPARADTGRAALCRRARRRAPWLLGRDLRLPRPGAPHADDHGAGTHGHRQPPWRATRVTVHAALDSGRPFGAVLSWRPPLAQEFMARWARIPVIGPRSVLVCACRIVKQ